jgi:hypothetical protein
MNKKQLGIIALSLVAVLVFAVVGVFALIKPVSKEALKGEGDYVLVSYSLYPEQDQSSFKVTWSDLDEKYDYEDLNGVTHTTTFGTGGMSLISQTMDGVQFGFLAYGPFEEKDVPRQIDMIASLLQLRYPAAYVSKGYCRNGYFDGGIYLHPEAPICTK